MKRRLIYLLLFTGLNMPVHSALQETLPSWHWAYGYIDELRLRSGFDSLFVMNRPYTRGEVAGSLVEIMKREADGRIRLSPTDKKIVSRLEQEFRSEIQSLRNEGGSAESPRVGVRLQPNLDGKSGGSEPKVNGVYRSKVAVPLGRYGAVYNGMVFDQYLVNDSLYMGKKWRGMVNYTEQAYLALGLDHFYVKFGRDFLRWGAGRSGTLIFSDVARPLDQLNIGIKYGPFRYSFLASVLDSWRSNNGVRDSLGTGVINRYLSAHRLDARFFHNRLQCAVSEVILYGGLHRILDWKYLNPFLPFHAESNNDADVANTLGSLDLIVWPKDGMEFYGSFLIDDIQVEKTGPGDLEPNELGWIVGGRIADPILFSAFTLFFEYAKVTNRTYKTPNPWETFIHRNITLGHPLGDDFDRLEIGFSKWFTESFWGKLSWTQIRKGEGSMYTPFDEPWLQYTVEQGYHELFPTGVVEKRKLIGLAVRFYPSMHAGLEAEFRSEKIENAGHVRNKKTNETFWRLGLWLDGDFQLNEIQ
jgi:hypothetical protein